MRKQIEQLILRKLAANGPMWANSFRGAKPVVASMVERGLIVRVAPEGGKARNMIALPKGMEAGNG